MSTYRACLAHYLKSHGQKQLYSPQEGFTVLEKALVASASMEGQSISSLHYMVDPGIEEVDGDDVMDSGTRNIDHMLKEALGAYNAYEFSVIMSKMAAPPATLTVDIDLKRGMGPEYEDKAYLSHIYENKKAIKFSLFDDPQDRKESEPSKEADLFPLPPQAGPSKIIAKVVKKKTAPAVLTMAERREAEAKAALTKRARLTAKAEHAFEELEKVVQAEDAEEMESEPDVVIESTKHVDPKANDPDDYSDTEAQ